MSGLSFFLIVAVLSLTPSPNYTTSYIKFIALVICSAVGLFNIANLIDWDNIINSFTAIQEQYHLFLVKKTSSESQANAIIFLTYFLAIQSIIIVRFFIFKK